ncbi:glutamate ABC transporter substrate-binding protein [Nakamurella flavida]|uniref:Glutamate ABC transporter substrate-binding protein n=1 Tax=Nakamurella flavida TaxID=363630 RepID=A0A939C6P2_9ACTN|nr:glutamate ABC transporter substrate-binding protein [Nakamurella flavida]MBM9478319.1 glutamate ABC transporter substrate-binding protein [Nakamurella flavida]MDP9777510.1 glutamate transport system substrate-binding protein [Nakamurella flavida]
MKYRTKAGLAGVAALALLLSACGGNSGSAGGVIASGTAAAGSATSAAGSAVSSATSAASSAASSATGSAGGSATGSAAAGDSALLTKAEGGSLIVGIKYDQPGLGLKNPDGSFSGFDVEVAKYVAEKLGVPESGIEFKESKSAERENLIDRGEVDYIVATYSITDARKEKVNFAGPYFVAHQDLLVKADNADITGPDSLDGKILCSVTGSTPAQKVKDNYSATVALQEFGTYTECVEALRTGVVDAVTTDDVILAGYAAQYPGELKLVGSGFSDENYGIGLAKGDDAGTTAINDAIQAMIDDGSWAAALESTVGPSGYTIPTPPTPGS